MPRDRDRYHRIELYLLRDDPMAEEILKEAAARQVPPSQHIADLLRGRYLARHGDQHLSDLLWIPSAAPAMDTLVEPVAEVPIEEEEEVVTKKQTARAAASAWGSMLKKKDP